MKHIMFTFTGKIYARPGAIKPPGSFYDAGKVLCTTCRQVFFRAELPTDTLGRPLCPDCRRMVRVRSRSAWHHDGKGHHR